MACFSWLMVAIVAVGCLNFTWAKVQLIHLSTEYLPYNVTSAGPQFNLSSDAVEQVSIDTKEKIAYGGGYGVIHVIDVSNTSALKLLYSNFTKGLDFTDVEVCGEYVFLSADNVENNTEGQLHVYKTHKKSTNTPLTFLKNITVGTLPDNIYPRPDCKSVIIALEAEAFYNPEGTLVDPDGAVVIVTWPNGVEDKTVVVKKLEFKEYNNKWQELLPSGVRFVYRENNNTFSADVEPEFIALDQEGNKAYVCLQENNGIAEVDLATETIVKIYGLGYKEFDLIDASDRDQGIQLSYWPIRAWYQPDNIQFVNWKGRKLVITANEGDQKKYTNFKEFLRGKQFTALGNGIPDVMKSWLLDDAQLGRLKMSRLDGLDENGLYQSLYAFGGRSFSIRDAADNFKLLYDSGSDIEKTTAMKCPHAFNTEGDIVDEKSDSKGPETESLATFKIGEVLYIVIGNENPGTLFVYSLGEDVTKPKFETIFCDGLKDNQLTLQEKFDKREVYALDPEDLKYVSGQELGTDYGVLFVAGSTSGTVSALKVVITDEPAVSPKTTP